MIEYIALSAGIFCGLAIYQYRQPAGITPLDIIFCAAVAVVWPIAVVSACAVGVLRVWGWIESCDFMNRRIFKL